MTSLHAAEPAWAGEVIGFWFEELTRADWFKKNDAVDQTIRDRFLAAYERVAAGAGDPEADPPRQTLASVIALDQFPRNMFRNSPRAFEADPVARKFARAALNRGIDSGMTADERLFLYLPFEHSEDRADQELSVMLIGALGNEELTRYALAHKTIIDRFGRFPHRNGVLGRSPTADEIEFLEQPMSSF